jgi:outer membrane receptor protein involved in Fe transport
MDFARGRSGLWPQAVILFAFFALVGAVAGGEPGRGEIHLLVEDSTGAAMPAAGKLDGREFATDAQGGYVFPGIAAGRHRLEVSKPGFATRVMVVTVRGGARVSEVVKLEPASTSTTVDVVATTPLAGANLTKEQIAAPVETATSAEIQASGALNLADFLNRRMNGINVNGMQGNPFQMDVNFRGYTASPLLGTPEGISVYLDGVRQNQPFGDVVAWDLIPKNAIAEMSLVPGADPLFGLNTLGGAISVQTKDGVSYPGWTGTLLYGSSGRKEVDATWGGGKATGFNWFLSGTGFHESGWRYDSPSDVRQAFVRLGWRTEKTDLALTTAYAYNTLLGNGLQDYRLLAANYASTYTPGDVTADRAPMFNFIAQHTFSEQVTFSANAWFRNIRTEAINPNFNSDVLGNDIYQPTAAEQAVLSGAGYTNFPAFGANSANTPFPYWACLAEAIRGGNPDGTCDGLTIYSKEVQNDFGFSGQATWIQSTRIGRNQFSAGILWDRGSIGFTQNSAYGYINPNYTITSVGAWQDGSTGIDSRVNLRGATPNWSPYFSDTLTLPQHVNLTVSGRYDRFTVNNTDLLNPAAGPGSLTGDYVFQRFNPAVGLTWSPVASVNAYARFSQGSRAPTSIELGCADPVHPCSLPNAFSSDPPLEQVVNDSWEVGVRGAPEVSFARNLNWNVGAFRGENHNDILFVSSVLLGTGYFQNFAKTLREGFDADVGGRIGGVTWGLDYTFLSATYQSTEAVNGQANDTSDSALEGYPGLNGNIYVHPGDRIPLIPKHTGRAWVVYQATKKLAVDLDEIAISSSYARGNENNAYQPDGVYYLGPGVSPGYAVTNLRAHYDLSKRLQLGVEVDNVFDRRYYTAAQLSNTAYTAQGTVETMPYPAYTTGPYAGSAPAQSVTFFAPGAPRRAWVELILRF